MTPENDEDWADVVQRAEDQHAKLLGAKFIRATMKDADHDELVSLWDTYKPEDIMYGVTCFANVCVQMLADNVQIPPEHFLKLLIDLLESND